MFEHRFVSLLGPNRWSHVPMLELHYAESLALRPVHLAQLMSTQLLQFLASNGYTTTHPQSVQNATTLAESLPHYDCHADIFLMSAKWFSAMAGVPTQTAVIEKELRSLSIASEAIMVVAMEMEEYELSRRCFELSAEFMDCIENNREFPLATKFRELFDYADDVRLGPSSRAILRAARRRDIPYMRLNRGSLVQLGEGKYQRRIWTAETDATSAIAEAIASDKDLTKRFLRQVGVPVPRGRQVANAEDAWVAAQEIGFPVVVKPVNANHQRGISIELYDREEILKAYDWAVHNGETQDIMVEQFAKGYHHRLLVVGNRMVAAAMGHSETVTGDGKQSILELIEEVNKDPRRGEAYTDPLDILKLNTAVMIELKKQGFDADSIPDAGQVVLIRRTGDLTTDCTDQVHPDLAEQAVLAARVVGLDIAGLDILATDISQPLELQSGAVVEVNAGPSLSPHVSPLFGKPQKVGDAIVDLLFPNDSPSRIQLIGIAQSPSSDVLVEQLSAQLRLRNLDFGMVSHGQAGFNGRIVDTGCENDASRVVALLGNPILSALIIHVTLETSATVGTCTPRLDRLIVPRDILPDQPTVEHQAGLRAIIHAVSPNGSIFCDGLPASAWHSIVADKQSSTKAQNTLDGAFEV